MWSGQGAELLQEVGLDICSIKQMGSWIHAQVLYGPEGCAVISLNKQMGVWSKCRHVVQSIGILVRQGCWATSVLNLCGKRQSSPLVLALHCVVPWQKERGSSELTGEPAWLARIFACMFVEMVGGCPL